MPLALVHRLKSGQHVIPLNEDEALKNSSFAVYRDEKKGEVVHTGIGWRFLSTQKPGEDGKKPKYMDHSFEILIAPEALDKYIEALQWAREQFRATNAPSV